MTTGDVAVLDADVCRFPGCVRPVAERAGTSGRRPGYCDDPAHTAVTAWRARRAQPAVGGGTGLGDEQPVTMAATRASVLRDDLVRLAGELGSQLDRAVEALETIADPDEAMVQIEQAAAETGERLAAAQAAQSRAEATARQATGARQRADDAAAELSERLAAVEAQLAEAAGREEELVGKLAATEAELGEASGRVEVAEAEAHRLTSELAETRGNAERHAAQAEAANERAEHYRQAATKAEAQAVSVQERADEAAVQLAAALHKIDELRDGKNALEVQLSAATQRADDATTRAEAAEKAKADVEAARWEAEKTVVRLTTRLESRGADDSRITGDRPPGR